MLTKDGPWMHGFGHLQHMPSHTFVRLGQVSNAHPDQAIHICSVMLHLLHVHLLSIKEGPWDARLWPPAAHAFTHLHAPGAGELSPPYESTQACAARTHVLRTATQRLTQRP